MIPISVYFPPQRIEILQRQAIERMGKRRLSGFKIIALASLTTWGGILKDGSVDVSLESFRSRVPLASAFPQFALENALLSAAFRNEFTLCIIGFGLFYGNNGIDLKDIFR